MRTPTVLRRVDTDHAGTRLDYLLSEREIVVGAGGLSGDRRLPVVDLVFTPRRRAAHGDRSVLDHRPNLGPVDRLEGSGSSPNIARTGLRHIGQTVVISGSDGTLEAC